ncbi:hypothetical protein [Undibacterium sp. SXout11W]|uniref:hypothetical protein n=1 Tax=Undibacterium sp. SXout11W TaxID=3413050 RepID=UPI003BF5BE9B
MYVLEPGVVGVCADVPEVACVPDHAPDAVQLVALVVDHVTVDDDPRLAFGLLNVSEIVGAGVVITGVEGGDVPTLLPPPHPAIAATIVNKAARFFLFISIPS